MAESFEDLRVTAAEGGLVETDRAWLHRKCIPWTIIVQPLQGGYVVTGAERAARIAAGEACVVAAGAPIAFHHVLARGRMRGRWLHVRASWREVLDPAALRQTPWRIRGRAAGRIGELIAAFAANPGAGVPDRLARMALATGALAEALAAAPPHPGAEALVAGAARLAPLTAWMRANLHRPIGIDGLARAAGLSRSRLHALFQRWVGRAPMAQLKELRLTEAAHRLLVGEGSVAAVAEAVGFANPFHFSREFGRRYGIPPRRYRDDQRLTGTPPG